MNSTEPSRESTSAAHAANAGAKLVLRRETARVVRALRVRCDLRTGLQALDDGTGTITVVPPTP